MEASITSHYNIIGAYANLHEAIVKRALANQVLHIKNDKLQNWFDCQNTKRY